MWAYSGAISLVVVIGCSSTASSEIDPADAGTCTPGTTTACVGAGQCAGGQVCNTEGTGYGPCDCGSGGSGGAGNAGGSSGSGATASGSAYALYSKADGARIVAIDRATGSVGPQKTLTSLPGIARALAVNPGGPVRLLINGGDGNGEIWQLDGALDKLTATEHATSADLGAYTLGHTAQGAGLVAWRKQPEFSTTVWTLSSDDSFTASFSVAKPVQHLAWPSAIVEAPDESLRLMWAEANGPPGCRVNTLTAAGVVTGSSVPFPAQEGYFCRSLSFDGSVVRIGYGDDSSGGFVCTFGVEPKDAVLPTEQGWAAEQCLTLDGQSGESFRGYYAPYP